MDPGRQRLIRLAVVAALVAALGGQAVAQTSGPDPQVAQAWELLRSQRVDEALALMRTKLEAEPENAEALYVAALALGRKGRPHEAAALLERSVAVMPDSPAARQLGLMRGSQKRYRDCLRLLRGWFETHRDDIDAGTAAAFCAIELYRAKDVHQLLEYLPRDLVRVRIIEGRLMLFESRLEDALTVLEPALSEAGDSMAVDVRRLMAEAHLGLGQAAQAVEVLRGFDSTPQLALYLAEAEFQMGDVEAALGTLEPWAQATLRDGAGGSPSLAGEVLRDHGRLLLQSGRSAEAIRSLEAATRLAPNDKQPWRLLGQAYAGAGSPADAERALERFRELASLEPPESVKDRQAKLELQDPTQNALREAAELAQSGRLEEALILLEREARLVPADARPTIVAARLLLDAGRHQEALQAAERAASVEPESPLPPYESARVLIAMGELDDATRALETALSVRPDFADALVTLAEIELTRGNVDAARRALDRALALEPGHPRGRGLAASLDRGS